MKITFHLAYVKNTRYSFEVLPPFIELNILSIYNTVYPLIELNPPFINVTYHINNEVQKKYKRIDTIAICGAIIYRYEIDTIPHLLCSGFTKKNIEKTLIELNLLGVYNLLILRGDIIKFTTEQNIYNYSIQFVKQIVALNKDIYKYYDLKNRSPSSFCIGIAGYSEKHFEAPNIEEDLYRLYEKIKAGSYFIMTQMFFDNNKYYDLIEKMHFANLKVSIIPGIKPISSIDQLKKIPSNFYVEIPINLVNLIMKYKKDIFNIGIEWAVQQSIELKEAGISVIHYFTMSKPDNIYQIVIELIGQMVPFR